MKNLEIKNLERIAARMQKKNNSGKGKIQKEKFSKDLEGNLFKKLQKENYNF